MKRRPKAVFSAVLALVMALCMLPIATERAEEVTPNERSYLQNAADYKANTRAFVPRLSMTHETTPNYYTSWNVFYASGYGMPNCTCYAFGRAFEILGSAPNLSYGNAGLWWGYNQQNGYYPSGQIPALGAIACWSKPGGAGHVAVVEQINGDEVITSESAWQGTYFFTKTRSASHSNFSQASDYQFQGFIYVYDRPGQNFATPTFATISTDKNVYAINETVNFNIASDGNTNTIWIYPPNDSVQYYPNAGTSYQIAFETPGRYEALVKAWIGPESFSSERISFMVEANAGDIDSDGSVTVLDALLVLRMAMNIIPVSNLDAADVNGDGAVTVTDALEIMRVSIGYT